MVYFELHQAPRLHAIVREDTSFDYIDHLATEQDFKSRSHELYEPVTEMLLRLVNEHPGTRLSLAVSGIALEQLTKHAPRCVEKLQELCRTGAVEILAVPYHYSLSALISGDLYKQEVIRHGELMRKYFGIQPKVLLAVPFFDKSMRGYAANMGFEGLLIKPVEHWAGALHFDQQYELPCFVTDMLISKKIAQEFGAGEATLSIAAFEEQIISEGRRPTIVGISYHIFEEHRAAGIENFIEGFLRKNEGRLITPTDWLSEHASELPQAPPLPTEAEDLSRWQGQPIQREALAASWPLLDLTHHLPDDELRNEWLSVLAADYFVNMSSTEWRLNSPYVSAHDAFVNYKRIVNGLIERGLESPAVSDDEPSKAIESERQHPTTPAWAQEQQSRYKEVTQSHL